MTARRLLIALTGTAAAAMLGACVSVLPRTEPDQLYSFGRGVDRAVPAAEGPSPNAAGVLLTAVDLPRASTGDGILTRDGSRNAYIAQSRWVGPATVLFREAVERAFKRGATQTRLISRGETGRAALVLRIDVQDFEAVFDDGPMLPPTVGLSLRARLTRPDGTAVAERGFQSSRKAADNRVGLIVDGYDAVTADVLAQLLAWTEATAAALPPTVQAPTGRPIAGPAAPSEQEQQPPPPPAPSAPVQ